MAQRGQTHEEELLRALGVTQQTSSTHTASSEESSLMDILLYMNTYETVLFWSLRSLVRALGDDQAQLAVSDRAAQERQSCCDLLSRACDAVQAAHDTLRHLVVPRLVKPSLLNALSHYVDESLFDDRTLARDVDALLTADAYCVEEEEGDREEGVMAGGHTFPSARAERVEGSYTDSPSPPSSSSSVSEDDGDDDAVPTASRRSPSGTPLPRTLSVADGDAGSEAVASAARRRARRAARQRAAARDAERQRQQRWQRVRDGVLQAPPPLSSAATLMASLVKALLDVYVYQCAQRVQPHLMVPIAREQEQMAAPNAGAPPSLTRFAVSGASAPTVTPLPYLFAKTTAVTTGSPTSPAASAGRARYRLLAQHPHTIDLLLSRTVYVKPPQSRQTLRCHGAGGAAANGSRSSSRGREEGLVLNFRPAPCESNGGDYDGRDGDRRATSAPDAVSRRPRRGQPAHLRDPFALAATAAHRRRGRATEGAGEDTEGTAPHATPLARATASAPSLKRPRATTPSTSRSGSSSRTVTRGESPQRISHSSIGMPGVPGDVQHYILLFLPPRYVGTAARVCRRWRQWITQSDPHFVSPLPYYAAASRAVTCSYLRFFREDWGERCVLLPSLTTAQRLYFVQVGSVAATVQAVWDSLEAESVLREWVWSRARELRVQHVESFHRLTNRTSVLADTAELLDVSDTSTDGDNGDHGWPAWGCVRTPVLPPSRPTTTSSRRLPVEYLVLYLWHGYAPEAPPHQALTCLMEALQQELLFTLVLPSSPAAGSPSAATDLAVEELLRHQYLQCVLLPKGSLAVVGGQTGRGLPVLRELWVHWPRVGALWAEMQKTGSRL